MDPLGFRIASGEVVVRRLETGKSWKKCAVLPVSAMTLIDELFGEVVGGPRGGSDNGFSNELHECEIQLEVSECAGPLGFPRRHALNRGCRGRPMEMRLLPPIMLEMVAAVLCSGAGFEHEALVWAGFLPRPCV
jgi:hypothetical protein